jgi:hypothetical protein
MACHLGHWYGQFVLLRGLRVGRGYSVAAVLGACGVVLRWVAWCGNQDAGDEGPRAGECQNAKGCESMWTAL